MTIGGYGCRDGECNEKDCCSLKRNPELKIEPGLHCTNGIHIFTDDTFCICGQRARAPVVDRGIPPNSHTDSNKNLRESMWAAYQEDLDEFLAKRNVVDNSFKDTKIGVKYDQGKPPMSMVSHVLMEEVSKVRAFGAKKYDTDNWKSGFKVTRSLSSALRHIFAFLSGQDKDEESGQSHLAHAICCLEHALWDMRYHPNNDDRYKGENK